MFQLLSNVPPRAGSCIKHDHVNHRWELSTAFLSLWFTLRSFNISESSSLAVINNSAERILPLLRECKYIEARWCDKQPSVTLNAALIGFVQKSTSDALLTITSKHWIHLIIHCLISWRRFLFVTAMHFNSTTFHNAYRFQATSHKINVSSLQFKRGA